MVASTPSAASATEPNICTMHSNVISVNQMSFSVTCEAANCHVLVASTSKNQVYLFQHDAGRNMTIVYQNHKLTVTIKE
ncbi:hypothetical protein L596_016013 [Steinernema carpocapsae]|uniref:Uncharacterized protein n=1 Tax=Steinernema carpocapsae TaxID=34508 RepID=A0A4U5NGR4_STECR|nr:hypothetical protein L596_016013 [Steinernema carpocapsae]